MNVRYEVVDLRYSDGGQAILRHTDGSGFAYYPSGSKAICICAHGADGKGKARRFSAIIHADGPRGIVVGVFDEWGKGQADAVLNPGETQAPKLMIGDKELTLIDSSGQATTMPRATPSASSTSGRMTSRSKSDMQIQLNSSVTVSHQNGRTTVGFQGQGVNHSFVLGELLGEEVAGMTPRRPMGGTENTPRGLMEVTQKLQGVREQVSAIKVDTSQKGTKPAHTINTANLQEVLDNLSSLQQTLAHPNLAPPNLEWKTEKGLKKLLAAHHAQFRPQAQGKNWTIAKFSGKCTEERLTSAKPTVATPRTVELVSMLRLPELIEESSQRGKLLVVICLATFAKEPSAFAQLLAEKAHAELWLKFGEGTSLPVRLVAVELSEASGFSRQYGVKEVPYCLMFQNGNCVHSKGLSHSKVSFKDTYMARPRVLLVEPNPSFQFKIERILKRNGFESDLAMDGAQAARLSSTKMLQPYGIVLASLQVHTEQLKTIASNVKGFEPNALMVGYNAGAPAEEDLDSRKRFFEECVHVFPFLPSYTGLAAVAARHDSAKPSYQHVGHSKKDLVDEILNVLEGGGRSVAAAAPPPVVEAT